MNIQFYLEKLLNFETFQEFSKKNPEDYLCSGFFIIDKESKDDKAHLDYYLPKEQ